MSNRNLNNTAIIRMIRAIWQNGTGAVAHKLDLYVPLIILLHLIPRIVYCEIHFMFTRSSHDIVTRDPLIYSRLRSNAYAGLLPIATNY